jgi:ribosomal protein S18 acetylase RimI-like enzyme
MLTAELVYDIDEKIVTDIAFIERHSYPLGWAYDDAQEYYAEMLRKPNNIPVTLRDNGRNVGFLLAIPQDDAVEELESDDPLIERDSLTYYLENIAILPDYRNKGGLRKMLEILGSELRKKAIHRISMHARISNNLSRNIQKHMKIIEIRRIEAWKYYNFEEPTDYIVAAWPADGGNNQ